MTKVLKRTATQHWATPLIGLPWKQGAKGPDAYDCLGLVQHVVRSRLGVELPDVPDIKESPWRPVEGPPSSPFHELDVVVLDSRNGRHIGILVASNGHLGVLHANGTAARGGSVMWQTLGEVASEGYTRTGLWRYQP